MGKRSHRSATGVTSAAIVYIMAAMTDDDPPINWNAEPNHIVQRGKILEKYTERALV
jgi:hypothetical protein